MNLLEIKLKKYIISFLIISIIYCIFLAIAFYNINNTYYSVIFSINVFVNSLFLSFFISIKRLKYKIALLLLQLYLVTITFLIYASLFYQEIKNLSFFFSYLFLLTIVYLFFGKKTFIYWVVGIVVLLLINVIYLYFNDADTVLHQFKFESPVVIWLSQFFNVVLIYYMFKTYKYVKILKSFKRQSLIAEYKTEDSIIKEKKMIELTSETSIHIESKQDDLYQKIIQIIETKEYYLNRNFNMTMLSVELNSNINYISKAINKYYPDGFNDLINKYRIDYFKKMVEEDKHKNYKLNYMFSKSGFKNQSTFNKAFKKIENTTPSEYILNKNSVDSKKYLE